MRLACQGQHDVEESRDHICLPSDSDPAVELAVVLVLTTAAEPTEYSDENDKRDDSASASGDIVGKTSGSGSLK